MPLVTVEAIADVFSAAQKKQLIEKMTDLIVEISGENIRPSTWVVIKDVPSGEWGVAGTPLTTEAVHRTLNEATPGEE